jgi:hypothetical protein
LFLLYTVSDHPTKPSIDKFLRTLSEKFKRQYIIATAHALKNKEIVYFAESELLVAVAMKNCIFRNITPCSLMKVKQSSVSGLLGFWTLSIVRYSKNTEEHNVSETGSVSLLGEGTGDTYSVGPVRKS